MKPMADKQVIIDRLVKNSAEVITEDELRTRLSSGEQLTHYIGFEISGYVHIGQGILSTLVMKDLTDLGVKCTVWLADWHTWINNKLDGTKETAARIGQGYFTEVIKACFLAVGGDPNKLEFRLASEWYAKGALRYFELEKKIEKETTLARMQRSISIAGKKEGEEVSFATLTYPAMQVADIFFQDIDIVHAGMDQRKAHAVMRDVAHKIFPKKPKPIALHHPLLMSLNAVVENAVAVEIMDLPGVTRKVGELEEVRMISKGELQIKLKMSKSQPDSAIFVHDSETDIKRKIKKAFCPEKEIKYNPILNWTKHLLFWNRTQPFKIDRKAEHGGGVEFTDFASLEKAYSAGEVHPMDLKAVVTKELITLLQPVRDHFAKPEIAAKKAELDKVLANR